MIREIVEQLKTERIKIKMPMDVLSQLSGVSQKHISNIENGKAVPTIDTLSKLAEPLGLKINIDVIAAIIPDQQAATLPRTG
ncbi:helix-turn-helix transcriptional regulator [Sporomusa sphaeroides DSM 2875]|uniref:helix-turn-helix domain-containing protein n=1 Tax=Sporomusa sphaeroides TaxID=47679 RepID=UPI00202FFB90|nr:helix-turn-helix transcriptional regulator [Sporomusa sphaeroides]MCM0757407.1 helix-turn-helix transcriptional regulator [Sporomusa sphaeroides DSM 2875]